MSEHLITAQQATGKVPVPRHTTAGQKQPPPPRAQDSNTCTNMGKPAEPPKAPSNDAAARPKEGPRQEERPHPPEGRAARAPQGGGGGPPPGRPAPPRRAQPPHPTPTPGKPGEGEGGGRRTRREGPGPGRRTPTPKTPRNRAAQPQGKGHPTQPGAHPETRGPANRRGAPHPTSLRAKAWSNAAEPAVLHPDASPLCGRLADDEPPLRLPDATPREWPSGSAQHDTPRRRQHDHEQGAYATVADSENQSGRRGRLSLSKLSLKAAQTVSGTMMRLQTSKRSELTAAHATEPTVTRFLQPSRRRNLHKADGPKKRAGRA